MGRKLRFADAAHAIEATPKTLRNWLQRGQVRFDFAGSTEVARASGWREFNASEIAVLAITRKLVEFGMTVEEASGFANAVLSERAALLLTFNSTPPQMLVAAFSGFRFMAWRDPPGERWRTVLADPGELLLPASACMVLAVADILERAITRAYQRGEDGE